MSQMVKIKIRPGQKLRFPAMCVHCARPAEGHMRITKRNGRISRRIDVPVCADCQKELDRKSGEEERLERIGRVLTVATGLLAFIVGYLILSIALPLLLRFLLAITLGALVAIAIYSIFRRKRFDAALPQKRAILGSARMVDFSWRATTFEFNNETFARDFAELNEPALMAVQGPDGET